MKYLYIYIYYLFNFIQTFIIHNHEEKKDDIIIPHLSPCHCVPCPENMNNELELSTKIPLRRKYPPYEAANLYMNNIINDVLFLFFYYYQKNDINTSGYTLYINTLNEMTKREPVEEKSVNDYYSFSNNNIGIRYENV